VPIIGIRILEGKCFEELAVLSREMEANEGFLCSLEVLMEAKEEKYTAITFFSLKILGHFLAVPCFSVSLPNTWVWIRIPTKSKSLDPDSMKFYPKHIAHCTIETLDSRPHF
jgi:hypothetical protein